MTKFEQSFLTWERISVALIALLVSMFGWVGHRMEARLDEFSAAIKGLTSTVSAEFARNDERRRAFDMWKEHIVRRLETLERERRYGKPKPM